MKIDLPNLVYIIAIIAWVVIGFIKKNRKKDGRPATTMPPVGEPQQPDIGDILEEILGKKKEEQKPKTVVVPTHQTKPQKPQKVFHPKTPETIPATDSFKQKVLRQKEKNISSVSEADSSIDFRSIFEESQFDLRKAIIYSEIMKPPYQ